MVSVAILTGLFVGVVPIMAAFLWLGARWQRVTRGSYRRAVFAVLVPALALVCIHAVAVYQRLELIVRLTEWTDDWSEYELASPLLIAAEAAATAIVSLLAVKFLLAATWRQTFFVWLLTLVPVAGAIVLVFLVVHPYLVEPMQVRYGSMCPTLLNITQSTDCPECGARAYTPWILELSGYEMRHGQLCVCSECRRLFRSRKLFPKLNEPDSFVVNKLLMPRRWDLVVYCPIHLPSYTKYRVVRRVIGMPGEEVVIKEGGVWINGARLELPDEIAGLEYFDQFEDGTPIFSGTPEKPARLGGDEYFVIGDYSYRSSDSRTWVAGIEGRARYALPATRIEGVVDLRYAPWGRWHWFR